jgi:ribosomal protein L28
MSFRCENCDKHTVIGISQRHHRGVAGKRWKKRAQATTRTFKPNLQTATVIVEGKPQKLTLCTRCLKKFKKNNATIAQNIASL